MTSEVTASEPNWFGCVVPAGLLYDVDANVWLRLEGDEAVLGMTDIGQTLCGKLVSVTWKSEGRTVKRGRPLAVIESAKWVGPFPSPVTGVVVASNQAAFAEDILVANRDPYGTGWLVRLRLSDFEAERQFLCDGAVAFERYREFIEANDIRCFRCAD